MKKTYSSPEITVVEQIIEPVMFDTSIDHGGNGDGYEAEAKRTKFEFEFDDDDLYGWGQRGQFQIYYED